MGLSSSKQTTTTNQTQNQQATTTPQNPEWVTNSIQDWIGRIGSFGDADPNSFVAPASPLQQQAWNNTGQLNAWKGQMQSASDLGFRAANAGANQVGSPSTYSAPKLGGAAQQTAYGYTAPQLGQAAQVSAQGYQAPTLGTAKGYDAQQASATGANSFGGDAFLSKYLNPYLNDVVGATANDFDQGAGQVRAQQAAQAAKSGAFGGSRFGIREAQTEGELARARASTLGGLRAQGFNTAAGLGMADADRMQQGAQFNANNATNVSLANAANENAARQFGAASQNQFGLANAGFQADAGQFNAGLGLQAGLANQGANNNFALANAGMQETAQQFTQGARNAASAANTGAQNQFSLAQAGMDTDAARYGADAANQTAQFNAGQQDIALNRGLAGAGQLADMANTYGSGVRSDLGLMADLGNQQRSVEQGYRMAPLAQMEMLGSLLGTTPFGLFNGQTVNGTSTGTGTNVTKSSPSLFDSLLSAGQLGATIFSDRRLKTNIQRVGEMPDGLGVYEYDYVWGGDRQRGVMADEVATLRPHALGPVIGGYATVNYGAL